jgi:hypothetical protein
MENSERSRLIEIIKTGKTDGSETPWDYTKLTDMPMCLRRVYVVLSMENTESEALCKVFKEMAEAAVKFRRDEDVVPHRLPYSVTIDRIVELYSEPGCPPELFEEKKEYVRALARLTYGEY